MTPFVEIIFAVGLSVGFAVTEVLFGQRFIFWTTQMFLRDAPRRCFI